MFTSLLLTVVVAVSNATTTRVGTDPITVTRYVGQVVVANLTVVQSSSDVKFVITTVTYDPLKLSPKLPGGVVQVPGGTVAVSSSPGSVVVTFTGACPIEGGVFWTLPFNCVGVGDTQLDVKSCLSKDSLGGDVFTTCESLDRLIIRSKLAARVLLQP